VLTSPPRQWRVYVVDLAPRVGSKPGKKRPCIAIQPSEFGAAGHPSTVILPLTTRLVDEDAFPLRVRIPGGTAGLEQDSDVLVDQILAWDNSLFRTDLGELPDALQDQIRAALLEFLDLK
jgi:mRNA interferase MazF